MASMAEGAVAPVASTSSTSSQSPSVTSSPCWSQLSVAAALDIYNFFGLGAYYFVAADNAFQQAAVAAAAASYDPQPPRVKRRKIEVEESTTRLFDGKRNGRSSGVVTFKPYSDIRLDSSLNSSGLRTRELQQPLKRRHGHDGLSHIPTQKGSVVKNTQVIQPDRGCTIGNLFPEILSMIFEYLDVQSKGRVAQVSTRWKEAAYKKSVWKGMTATLHLTRSNPTLFASLAQRGIKHVQVLSLSRKAEPKDLVAGLPNMESLNLSGCYNLSDQNLDKAFNKNVSSLTSLNLSLCKDLSDNALSKIAMHCGNLRSLDLAGCCKITNSGLQCIAWGLKKLEHLNLRSCRQISDQGIASLCGLNGSELNSSFPASQSLLSLSLQDCQKLTDESLRYIAQGLPKLRGINLSFCVSITDTGLKSLAKMASLEDLNLRSCDNVSDIGIGFLAEEHGRIQALDMSFCGNVTDASLRHLASSQLMAASLQRLAMTTCAITDDGLVKMAKSSTRLQELHMGQCVKLSDLSLEAIAANMKELTSIDLYGCPDLSPSAIDKLKRQLPKLNKLNLSL